MSHLDAICLQPKDGSEPRDEYCGTYSWVSGEEPYVTYSGPNGHYISPYEVATIRFYYIDFVSTENYYAKMDLEGSIDGIGNYTALLSPASQYKTEEGVCQDWSSSSTSSSSSSSSMDSSSSSSTFARSSSSSSSSAEFYCNNPVCSGDCSKFTSWTFSNLNSHNSGQYGHLEWRANQYYINVTLYTQILIYNNTTLVASCTFEGSGSGIKNLQEQNNSGLTGSVNFQGGAVNASGSLDCPNSSSSSSTQVEKSSSSSSSQHPCNCTTPSCYNSSNCSDFANWTFNGMTMANSDHCRLYVKVIGGGSDAEGKEVFIYNNSARTAAYLVAYGFCNTNPNTMILVEQNSSGLSGSVYSYTFQHSDSTMYLECPDSSSSTSSLSSNSSSSSSSYQDFVHYNYLSCEINGSSTKNHYIELFDYRTLGYNASDRDFYGDIWEPGNLTLEGYIKLQVNGSDAWFKIYEGDASTSCCTNLEGEWRPV